ncbi:hypothetical protein HDU84_005781 [Entophlyctis sp. JEL0112]|nr:hypothetical protein HDU84_005781 [Entophlyctis sp. JEL0112]
MKGAVMTDSSATIYDTQSVSVPASIDERTFPRNEKENSSPSSTENESTTDADKLHAARTDMLIQMVVKVMARLFYGGNQDVRTRSLEALTKHYNELLAVKQTITTIVERVPVRNLKALSVTLMHALLLVHRMLNVPTSETTRESGPMFDEEYERHPEQNQPFHHIAERQHADLPQSLAGSPKRVFIAGLMLAEVATMDCPSSSKVWGALSGLTRREIAAGKNAALVHLQYGVHVSATELMRWSRVVLEWLEKTQK